MKIITWNVKVDLGRLTGAWEKRSTIFTEVLLRELPDIFCAQEARKHQVDFFSDSFPKAFSYVGVGREDGKGKGEFCPIFYNTDTISMTESGTFWLSPTPEVPSRGYDYYPRICTWGRFREKQSSGEFLVFNIHLPLALNFRGKRKALDVVLKKVRGFGSSPVILAGDFNAGPSSTVWRNIFGLGFREIPKTGRSSHYWGVPFSLVDAIFVRGGINAGRYELLKDHRGRRYPSDHFGIVAEIRFF